MKRTRSQRNQPLSHPRCPGNSTKPQRRFQNLFRNHSESVNKALIRNNNLQLPFSEDQTNPEGLLSFHASGGQFRPHSAGLNRHQAVNQPAMGPMTRFGFGSARPFNPFILYPSPRFCLNAFNYFTRFHQSNAPRIPSTARQFQETQRHWNAKFTQQRYRMHNSATPAFDSRNNGHEEKGYSNKSKESMRRKWQFMPEADRCRPNDFTFSLVTYNILSDSLLYENMYLYEDCDQEHLGWGYRKEKLLAELLSYEAEILCLQEVDACHYEEWFRPKLLEAGYTGLFIRRTGERPDGCAMFYRHAKFTLVRSKLVKYYTPQVPVLDKDNVGIVALLKVNTLDGKAKDSYICVANTHLLFNKKRGDIKLAQLAYLFAEINELAVLSHDDHRKTHCPVILCGDLNSLPYSPLYHFLITGQLQYTANCPAVISGQLTPSQVRKGPSARRIRSPLLPWEFGVTEQCQWREGKSEGSCMHTQDKRTLGVTASNSPTQNVQHSEKLTERGRDAEDHSNNPHDCESNSSTPADPCENEIINNHVDSVSVSDFTCSRQESGCLEDWKSGKSGRDSEFIDLTRDAELSSSFNTADDDANRVCISSEGSDGKTFTANAGLPGKTEKQHSDMPSPTASSRHANLQSEQTTYNNSGIISIPWLFDSVYTHRFGDENPEVTTCHSKACCNVDYIFYTAGVGGRRTTEHREYVQTGKLTLLGRLQLMRKSDFNTMSLLPNQRFPSDHLSLQARFMLT